MSDPMGAVDTWTLTTVASSAGPIASLQVGDRHYDLCKSLGRAGALEASTVLEVLENWSAAEPMLDRAAALVCDEDLIVTEQHLAPVLYPGKVICAAANYYNHLAEFGFTDISRDTHRLGFFFKPPRNAVVGEGNTVHIPLDCQKFDWEIELAVVIGRRAWNVPVERAMEYVAGYTVAIDFSARDLFQIPEHLQRVGKTDWVTGKAHETSCPLGPGIVPARFIPDPQALRMRLSVNNQIKQDSTGADMIFSIAEQIATASKIMALHPGDVLLTGTPSGVGWANEEFLTVGDRVDAEIECLGTLSVTIQAPLVS